MSYYDPMSDPGPSMLSGGFGFTPNLDYSPSGSVKKSDFLKALTDREKRREKAVDLHTKLSELSSKRDQALKELQDSHDELGKFVPAQEEQPKSLPVKERWLAGGLAVLARALGGSDAMPGLTRGLAAYQANRKEDFARAADQINRTNQSRDARLLASLKAKESNADLSYRVASGELSQEQGSQAALEREKAIAERMYGIQTLKGDQGLTRDQQKRDWETNLPKNWTPEQKAASYKTMFPDATDEEVKAAAFKGVVKEVASAHASQANADWAKVRTDYFPEHMQNERSKVELSLGLLKDKLDDGAFDTWFKMNDLGIRTTAEQNRNAEQVAQLFEANAKTWDDSAAKFEASASGLEPKIASAQGEMDKWGTVMTQYANKEDSKEYREAESKFNGAQAESTRLKTAQRKLRESAADSKKSADGYKIQAAETRNNLKKYEVTKPPERKASAPKLPPLPKVGKPTPLKGDIPLSPDSTGNLDPGITRNPKTGRLERIQSVSDALDQLGL